MNSDRTVYAPEMDVEGNGVAPRLSVKIVWIHHDRYFARLFNPFFFFFFFPFIHLFIHPPSQLHTNTYTNVCHVSNLEQIFRFYATFYLFWKFMPVFNFARNYDFLFLSSKRNSRIFFFSFFFLRLEYIDLSSISFFFDRPLILTSLLQFDSIQCTIKANHSKRMKFLSLYSLNETIYL